MKNKHNILFATVALLGASSLAAPYTFAADPYGITYTGGYTEGDDLSSNNVTIDKELVDSLTPLIRYQDNPTATPTDVSKWRSGYMIDQEVCKKYYFFTLSSDTEIDESDGLGYVLSNGRYDIEVNVKSATSKNLGDKVTTIGINETNGYIFGGWKAYADAECTQDIEDTPTVGLSAKNSGNAQVFAELDIKLHKSGDEDVFKSGELYFGITDIDTAQSYKIMNPSNLLQKGNMFAKSEELLQPVPGTTELRNKYVPDGNYIYSEYLNGSDEPIISGATRTNIYVKLDDTTQSDGLDVVFGFASMAGSGIEYYAKQYTVAYKSDENGEITGVTTERIIAGKTPDGPEEKPNDGYIFKSWIADIDVELADGTTIKAGAPITEEQITQVIVRSDITFTAIHEPIPEPEKPDTTPGDPEVPEEPEKPDDKPAKDEDKNIAPPNTGANTDGKANATLIAISTFGIMLGALIIALLPRLTHKKLSFKK